MAANAAASLLEWLALYEPQHSSLLHDAQSDAETLETLLQRAFPQLCADVRAAQPRSSAWERAVRVLEQFYETPLGIDTALIERIADNRNDDSDSRANEPLLRALEFALGAVVQCDDKATFVRDILTMRDAVQVDLMAVIESVMAQQSSSTGESDAADAASASATTDAPATRSCQSEPQSIEAGQSSAPASPSPPHLRRARNAELDRARRENAFLHDEISRVNQELQDAMTKLQQRDADNHALNATIEQLELEREVDLLRKERSVRAMYDDRLHALERDLEAANAALHTHASVATEANELRDEVDLLRPVAERATKAEATAATYKRKVEELAGVREALRRTEAANAELMKTNLSLEAHVAKTTALQRKLSEAKATNTAVEFRVSELNALLARQERELERLRADVATSEHALAEATALNAQLQQAIDAQRAPQDASVPDAVALGGGISELNPELMQTLARLEHENNALRAQVSGETSERIDELVDNLDTITRLKTSFETRYFATEQQLQVRDGELAASQTAVQTLEREVAAGLAREATLTAQCTSLETVVRDLNETIAALHQEIGALRECNAALAADVQSHEAERRSRYEALHHLESVVRDLEQRCAAQAQSLSVAAAQKEELCQTLDASHTRKQELETTIAEQETQIAALQSARDDLKTESQTLTSRVSELKEALAVADDALASRHLELTALTALFGATFEAKDVLEAALEQNLREKRTIVVDYEARLRDTQTAQTRLVEAHRQHVATLEAAHSASLARMTDGMSAKSMQIETLGASLECLKHEHAVAIDELTAQHAQAQRALQAAMEQYKSQHSVSNAERDAKERELTQQLASLETTHSDERNAMIEHAQRLVLEIERLNDTVCGLRDHEDKLRAMIQQQLESNQHLIATNQSFKTELKRRASTIATLEHSVTRLESKVHLLEKERAHVLSQDERKREVAQDEASVASQLSSHVSLVVAELEQLQRAHTALQTRTRACQCAIGSSSSGVVINTVDSTKTSSYVDRIRHLEQLKQLEETKRRELLLMNAKLVQAQRQLQTKNVALEREMQDVREKMNSWLLRDERRRNEADAMRRKLAVLTAKASDAMSADARPTDQRVNAVPKDTTELSSSQTASPSATQSAPVHRNNFQTASGHATHCADLVDENRSPNVCVSKKRVFKGEGDAVKHGAQDKMSSVADATHRTSNEAVTDALDAAPGGVETGRRSAKRRVSLFVSSRLQSSRGECVSEEKPSECQQQ